MLVGYIAPRRLQPLALGVPVRRRHHRRSRLCTLGSVLGSVFVIAIPFITSSAAVWSQVFFGLSLLLALWLFPGGLASLVNFFKRSPVPRSLARAEAAAAKAKVTS